MVAIVAITLLAQADVKTYRVGDLDRTAIVYAPSKKSDHPPLVFGFHGHGGAARQVARRFDLQSSWPEAVVVYPQGLATKTPNDPEGRRAGWQFVTGTNGDRDLKFFDAVLADVSKRYAVDPKRVYVMGHSNGASFTYLLWQMRPDKIAAVAPTAGVFRMRVGLEPLPCFVAGGVKDGIVEWSRQEAGIKAMSSFLGVTEKVDVSPKATAATYKGSKADMAIYVHSGAHEFPVAATKQMIEFFKSHPKK